MSEYGVWDKYYRSYPLKELGWELGKPRPILLQYTQKHLLPKGKTLDLCCGAGTNTFYLAKNSNLTTALDISKTAIEFAKSNEQATTLKIRFVLASFIDFPFRSDMFDLVFDMGCFHHVSIPDRGKFISGVHRVLNSSGVFLLTCFSDQNGAGWNHFTRMQLIDLFSGHFRLEEFHHYPSLEGDGVTRYFYTVLMKKRV